MSRPLELVHSDVRGLAPTIEHFDLCYYVLFIDDFNKYI